jgi:hypothetical protein
MLCAPGVVAEEHHYKKGDVVALLANKIGPYANPSCVGIVVGRSGVRREGWRMISLLEAAAGHANGLRKAKCLPSGL